LLIDLCAPFGNSSVLNQLLGRCIGCGTAASRKFAMFMRPIPAWLPTGRALLSVIASALAGGIVTLGGWLWLQSHGGAKPQELSRDRHFVALGRAYVQDLGQACAGAWNDGASALDSGQPVSAALDRVGKNWTSSRTALFDKLVAPEFAKIVPESIKDSDVTPTERAALAAAWRGFAAGLAK
jgi:hypothetical protein